MKHSPDTRQLKRFTIPKLADRLGVTPTTIRDWIAQGLLDAPPELPLHWYRAYPADKADQIERWYMRRAAAGYTRGPGARRRRAWARQRFEELAAETASAPSAAEARGGRQRGTSIPKSLRDSARQKDVKGGIA